MARKRRAKRAAQPRRHDADREPDLCAAGKRCDYCGRPAYFAFRGVERAHLCEACAERRKRAAARHCYVCSALIDVPGATPEACRVGYYRGAQEIFERLLCGPCGRALDGLLHWASGVTKSWTSWRQRPRSRG
jgi:hypothetical protein